MKNYCVYILTNKICGILYIGFTSDLKRRIAEHKLGLVKGFSKKYNLKKLVYFERFGNVAEALYREKQLKRWNRKWKIELVENNNSSWNDLYEKIFGFENKEYFDYVLNLNIYDKNIIESRE